MLCDQNRVFCTTLTEQLCPFVKVDVLGAFFKFLLEIEIRKILTVGLFMISPRCRAVNAKRIQIST